MAGEIIPRFKRASVRDQLNEQRSQLFRAAGIVHAVRAALDSSGHIEIDEAQLASALEAAGRLIDDTAGALESVSP